MEKVKVIFKKKRIYNDKLREIGDIVEMFKADVKGYLEFGVVEYYINNKLFDLEKLEYKELQTLAKRYKLPAVGKREDLVKSLKENIKK